MKAVVYTRKDTPEQAFKVTNLNKPSPKRNQVLVKVRSSAITNMEYMRFGSMGAMLNIAMNATGKPLGIEFSGIIEEVGTNVETVNKGEAVFGLAKGNIGAWAQYLIANEKDIYIKPDSLSFEEAGALATGGITGLGAINAAKIEPGQQVLVQGASGGVGHFVVQLAKAFGGIVTAVCSTRNKVLTEELGADYVVDYTKEDIATLGNTYDRIIAINGYQPLSVYKRLLNPDGRFVFIGGSGKAIKSAFAVPFYGVGSKRKFTMAAFPFQPKKQRLKQLSSLASEGKLRPHIDKVYGASEVAEAINYVLKEHPQGKVAIRMDFE